MRFSELFGISPNPARDDWFDAELSTDTPLYVDPFLIFDDPDPFWAGARDVVVEFFSLALEFIRAADGDQTSPHWLKAVRMLRFPEPSEFALGLAMGHPKGSGTGFKFAGRMAEALGLLAERGIAELENIQTFSLFCEGLSVDRISDVLLNILKAQFVTYTQETAARHAIVVDDVPVRCASWSRTSGRWSHERVPLPKSPVTGEGVLLAPRRFLKDIPVITPESFWTWADSSVGQDLRADLNYELNTVLSRTDRVNAGHKVAWKRPDLAVDYVRTMSGAGPRPYDVEGDPKLLVKWAEVGRDAAAAQESIRQPSRTDQFADWVEKLAREFQHAVEETDLWRALWDDGLVRPRPEKIVQAIAGSMFAAHCRSADVDLTRESNLGRGPVDFKFSRGWEQRALLEVKLIPSTHFFTGASRQLPQYLRTERANVGVYLCVGYSDKDFTSERLNPVEDTLRHLTAESGWDLRAIYVDARPSTKQSASVQR